MKTPVETELEYKMYEACRKTSQLMKQIAALTMEKALLHEAVGLLIGNTVLCVADANSEANIRKAITIYEAIVFEHNVGLDAYEALRTAAVRLVILTGRMRGCHEETGKHELMEEADMFCAEAKKAVEALCPEVQA